MKGWKTFVLEEPSASKKWSSWLVNGNARDNEDFLVCRFDQAN